MVIGTLDRFGYELRVLSETQSQAEKMLMKEYRKTYLEWNHCRPSKEEVECAKEEIFCDEVELDEVHWV